MKYNLVAKYSIMKHCCTMKSMCIFVISVTLLHWSTPRSLDRSSSAGLEQLTSGTLEACRTTWCWCWSDATALAGYAIIVMMTIHANVSFIVAADSVPPLNVLGQNVDFPVLFYRTKLCLLSVYQLVKEVTSLVGVAKFLFQLNIQGRTQGQRGDRPALSTPEEKSVI